MQKTDHRTIVLADHHKSVFVSCVIDQQTGQLSHHTLASRPDELEPFLRDLPGPVLVYVEACRSWEWVSDLCNDLGHDFRLIDPARMPEIWSAKTKTDRRDVDKFVDRFQVKGEMPESYRASRSERELRGLTRLLGELRHQRKRLTQMIHASIDAQGMPAKKERFGDEGWRSSMREALSPMAWLELEVLLESLDAAEAQARRIEERLHTELEGDHRYQSLLEIPGVGRVIAATILAECAGIRRFKKARRFASFVGVAPYVSSTGGPRSKYLKIGRITKAGPPLLRWALCQAVITGVRAKQQTEISRLYYRVRKKRNRAQGKVAICAAANKLARVIWSMLTKEEPFRPGSRAGAKA